MRDGSAHRLRHARRLERARRFYLEGLGWKAALDVPGDVAMIHVGHKLVLSLWAEAAARSELGEIARGGTLSVRTRSAGLQIKIIAGRAAS